MRAAAKSIFLIVIALYVVFTLFPIYWLASSSFKQSSEIFRLQPTLFPQAPTFANYQKVLKGEGIGVDFLWSLFNTGVVSVVVMLAGVFIGSLAGYGMSRSRSKFIYFLPFVFLVFSLTPPQTYAVPIFSSLRRFGLLDTRFGLGVVYLTFSLPFSVWFLSQYFKSIPREYEEGAIVDGCSRLGVLFRIVFPLSAPALMTSAIFSFMHTWNEFLFASILTSRNAMTMPVAIMSFQDARALAWDLSTAASMIAVVPLVVVLILLQRYVVTGLTAGGMKG